MGKYARAAGYGVLSLVAGIGALAAVLAACLALLVGLFVIAFHNGSGRAVGRRHLQPIPISKSACPYVRAMHVAAYDFELANPVIFGGSDVGDAKTQQKFFDEL